MKKQLIAQHLHHSILFADVSQSDLETYADFCRVQIVPEGDYIYQQGEASELFYVVAQGEVELVLEREDGDSRVVGRVSQGGHFGETGILTGKPRSLSVKALFDLVVICFEPRIFRSVLLGNPLIHKQLDAVLAERLRVAYLDQADTASSNDPHAKSSADDVILFRERNLSQIKLRRLEKKKQNIIYDSKSARQAQTVISAFAANNAPYVLTGESGTGKKIIARQIHAESGRSEGPYVEFDLRDHDQVLLERKLFGTKKSNYPFAQAQQAGVFERGCGGTIAFHHIRLMPHELQRKIVKAIESNTFTHIDSDSPIAMQSRVVFISIYDLDYLEKTGKIVPEMMELFRRQHFSVPSLREHKRDLPRLVEHYLGRFSKEYGKNITKASPETLGNLMNYDWPGNLTELSSVLRRAVMLANEDELLSDHILLGLPKSEGKWEFNILRFPLVKRFITSNKFPTIPQGIVGLIILATVLALFLGPREPDKNIGLIMSWAIGWPLLFFSFFFLARTWCSVCSLAMPGKQLQNLIKPRKNTPQFIKEHSGWIMAVLCIIVLWVEVVWNAYENPLLTGWIILAVTIGSCICSVLYSRRTWCRYLCPLGAINAIFAMPSIIELRSNRHVCMNRCTEHNCFGGGEKKGGCPMFRHPYLVDNNRDCIICGDCIKNCNNSSIHLNLRLAPQELWSLETPRRADSFLIVALGAIFFPFALHSEFSLLVEWLSDSIRVYGVAVPEFLGGSLVFFLLILIFQVGYYLMVQVQSWHARMDKNFLLPMLGYGFIPLILGGYMAVHFEVFVRDAGSIVPAIQELLGKSVVFEHGRILSPDSTYVLQIFTVVGGLLASMYATYRVIARILVDDEVSSRSLMLPYSFLITLAGLFVFMV
ncbi:sigma 54-interacting transcriptional regulator [Desulfosediminicola flagellatus]|uniref:sigma 54-interacting transcriptional regulator n=1 Tax=Desulfosediminicola flagellatus TaxID=2569541 RepID=UPI0010AC86DB|nr:sigma 54-interacting transcriptional regulator [Desulfosediminicola flagellatus]